MPKKTLVISTTSVGGSGGGSSNVVAAGQPPLVGFGGRQKMDVDNKVSAASQMADAPPPLPPSPPPELNREHSNNNICGTPDNRSPLVNTTTAPTSTGFVMPAPKFKARQSRQPSSNHHTQEAVERSSQQLGFPQSSGGSRDSLDMGSQQQPQRGGAWDNSGTSQTHFNHPPPAHVQSHQPYQTPEQQQHLQQQEHQDHQHVSYGPQEQLPQFHPNNNIVRPQQQGEYPQYPQVHPSNPHPGSHHQQHQQRQEDATGGGVKGGGPGAGNYPSAGRTMQRHGGSGFSGRMPPALQQSGRSRSSKRQGGGSASHQHSSNTTHHRPHGSGPLPPQNGPPHPHASFQKAFPAAQQGSGASHYPYVPGNRFQMQQPQMASAIQQQQQQQWQHEQQQAQAQQAQAQLAQAQQAQAQQAQSQLAAMAGLSQQPLPHQQQPDANLYLEGFVAAMSAVQRQTAEFLANASKSSPGSGSHGGGGTVGAHYQYSGESSAYSQGDDGNNAGKRKLSPQGNTNTANTDNNNNTKTTKGRGGKDDHHQEHLARRTEEEEEEENYGEDPSLEAPRFLANTKANREAKVNVEGELLSILKVLPNRATDMILDNPTRLHGRYCKQQTPHSPYECTFIHLAEIEIDGEKLPVSAFASGVAVEFLLSCRGVATARWCTDPSPHELWSCRYLHRRKGSSKVTATGQRLGDQQQQAMLLAPASYDDDEEGKKQKEDGAAEQQGGGGGGGGGSFAATLTTKGGAILAATGEELTYATLVDGSAVRVTDLQRNTGFEIFLKNPNRPGRLCHNMLPHAASTCLFLHKSAIKMETNVLDEENGGGGASLISDREDGLVPLDMLVPNVAVDYLLGHPSAVGRKCQVTIPHDVSLCTYIHVLPQQQQPQRQRKEQQQQQYLRQEANPEHPGGGGSGGVPQSEEEYYHWMQQQQQQYLHGGGGNHHGSACTHDSSCPSCAAPFDPASIRMRAWCQGCGVEWQMSPKYGAAPRMVIGQGNTPSLLDRFLPDDSTTTTASSSSRNNSLTPHSHQSHPLRQTKQHGSRSPGNNTNLSHSFGSTNQMGGEWYDEVAAAQSSFGQLPSPSDGGAIGKGGVGGGYASGAEQAPYYQGY